MPARFPQSATSLSWRIRPAWASKIFVIYWPAGADSVHRLRSGDNATTIVTRSASGATFNAGEGRISGTSTTLFTDSTGTSTGYGSLQENSNFTFGFSAFGDSFNGLASSLMIGALAPPDTFSNGFQARLSAFQLLTGFQGAGRTELTNFIGNDVQSLFSFAIRHNAADGTARQRIWGGENGALGSEIVPGRANPSPSATDALGSSGRPLHFGGVSAGTGNTRAEWECAWLGVALSDADMEAITANPADVIEAFTPPPGPAIPVVVNYYRQLGVM